jgi:predicted membrane protein
MNVNLLAVLIATIVRFILGALWYGPLFVKPWMKEIGKTDMKGDTSNLGKLLGITFVISLVSSYVLALFLGHMDLMSDILASLSVGVVWIGGAIWMNYAYAGRSNKLFLIDAGYHVVGFLLMGIVIGLMQ